MTTSSCAAPRGATSIRKAPNWEERAFRAGLHRSRPGYPARGGSARGHFPRRASLSASRGWGGSGRHRQAAEPQPLRLQVVEPLEIGRECGGLFGDPRAARRHAPSACGEPTLLSRICGARMARFSTACGSRCPSYCGHGVVLRIGDTTIRLFTDRSPSDRRTLPAHARPLSGTQAQPSTQSTVGDPCSSARSCRSTADLDRRRRARATGHGAFARPLRFRRDQHDRIQ